MTRITDQSESLFETAKELFPGGVNSPVRAFKSVGGTPLFFKEGKGSQLIDEDGNKYLDFCASWGPLILGHAHPEVVDTVKETVAKGMTFGAPTKEENKLGRLIIDNHRFVDRIRFVSSGTEAVMSAIRLARGYTGRSKIIKFEGCYHGHADHLLVQAGSGLATLGTSSSAGVPESFAAETIVLPLNDPTALAEAFKNYKDEIACVIIEPIPANNGLLLQAEDYLKDLRKITEENKTLLIFDEVISGFRVGFEGAAGRYGITPDLMTFGKIIGGGMPVGAYAGKKEIMECIAPLGNVYQAGTLSGNPVAMMAGYVQLSHLLKEGIYEQLEEKTNHFVTRLNEKLMDGVDVRVQHIGSIFWLAFTNKGTIRAAHEVDAGSMERFKKLYNLLLDRGIYMGPSGYEVGFVSVVHTMEELTQAADTIAASINEVLEGEMV